MCHSRLQQHTTAEMISVSIAAVTSLTPDQIGQDLTVMVMFFALLHTYRSATDSFSSFIPSDIRQYNTTAPSTSHPH